MNTKIIEPSGQETEIIPKNGKHFSLKEMQDIVGGMIEMIRTNDNDYVLILNEEGKLDELPYNSKATDLVNKCIMPSDYIVGTVLYSHRKYIK